MSTAPYDQDQLESDLNHLSCLLDQAVSLMTEMPMKLGRDQEIAGALIWVSRDLTDTMVAGLASLSARSIGR